jgi:arginyl-tRNA synthetase
VKKAIQEKGNEATDEIAVGAIKYMILKQAIGGDIVFDFDKSVSTEGDSGVYLQYAYVRAKSILEKNTIIGDFSNTKELEIESDQSTLEKLLYRFPEIVERAGKEYSPHYITTFLIEIASAFNNFYAHNQIINPDDIKTSYYRLALTKATEVVLKNGLSILGIPAPERM